MLVVARKAGESILIGDNIEIIILETGEGSVKVGINAPKRVKILRKELLSEVEMENIESIKNAEEIFKRVK
jgi:carbon storage regulator